MLNYNTSARPSSSRTINALRHACVLALLTALIILILQALAAAAELYGVVYSREESMKGIELQISTAKGKLLQTTTTNEQGMYQFVELRPGIHLIRCQGREWEVYVEPGHSRYDLYLD